MGVTYKLKDEIVEFIIRQKRENPRIGCRKIVIAIENTFGLQVSKSSINAVIKEAQLSSPVGRPSGDVENKKKFRIPKEKKVQLFGDPIQALVPDSLPEIPKESSAIPAAPPLPKIDIQSNETDNKTAITLANQPPEINIPITEDVQEDVLPSPQIDEVLQDFPKPTLVNNIYPIEAGDFEEFEIRNILPLLKKLSFEEYFPGPIFDEFFKRHTSLGEEEIKMVDVLACLLPDVFEDDRLAWDKEYLWLWKFSGFDNVPEQSELESLIRFLNTSKVPKFDFLLELEYFCSMAQHVKWVLSNNQSIILDGRQKIIDSQTTNHYMPCPIERVVDESTRFIEGQQDLVFYCFNQLGFRDILISLLGVCNQPFNNPVKKIIVLDEGNNPLLEFGQIPNKQRNFIIFGQFSSEQWMASFNRTPNFIDDQLILRNGQQFSYSDELMELLDDRHEEHKKVQVRVILINREDSGFFEICATNILRESVSAQRLFDRMSRPPTNLEIKAVLENERFHCRKILEEESEEIVIAQALKILWNVIEHDLRLNFEQKSKNDHNITDLYNLSARLKLNWQMAELSFLNKDNILSDWDSDKEYIINYYKETTYGGRKILFKL